MENEMRNCQSETLSSILDLQFSIVNSKTWALDKAEPVYYEESTLSRSGDFSLKPMLTIV